MRSSQAAVDLIVANEVSSRAAYEKSYKYPTWPGGASGVTVAIGYDLGYVTRDKVQEDFGQYLPQAMIIAMQNVVGLTGTAAHEAMRSVLGRVEIPWDVAMRVFEAVDMPRYEAMLIRACPGVELLPDDCFGALASITYNRGAGGFTGGGDRFREMRIIRADILAKNYADIPRQIRSMKRLWEGKGLPGLLTRRDAEARLFEKGLERGVDAPPVPQKDDLPDWLKKRQVTQPGNINVQPTRAKYSAQVRAVQEDLIKMNYFTVGDPDGYYGGKLRGSITAFMTDRGKSPNNGELTQAVMDEIDAAMNEGWSRPIKKERAEAKAKDIKDKVPIVNQTWWQKVWAAVLGIPTAAVTVFKSIFGDQGDAITSYVQPAKDALAMIPTEVYLLAIVGVAVAIFIQAKRVQDKTVAAYQRGEIN